MTFLCMPTKTENVIIRLIQDVDYDDVWFSLSSEKIPFLTVWVCDEVCRAVDADVILIVFGVTKGDGY